MMRKPSVVGDNVADLVRLHGKRQIAKFHLVSGEGKLAAAILRDGVFVVLPGQCGKIFARANPFIQILESAGAWPLIIVAVGSGGADEVEKSDVVKSKSSRTAHQLQAGRKRRDVRRRTFSRQRPSP